MNGSTLLAIYHGELHRQNRFRRADRGDEELGLDKVVRIVDKETLAFAKSKLFKTLERSGNQCTRSGTGRRSKNPRALGPVPGTVRGTAELHWHVAPPLLASL